MLRLKVIISLVALFGCINLAYCAVSLTLPSIHPDHPGKCWWNDTNTAYTPGDTFQEPGTCSEGRCNEDFSFDFVSCGVKSIDDPSCKEIDHDLSLPYPDCCVDYECTDADGKVTRF